MGRDELIEQAIAILEKFEVGENQLNARSAMTQRGNLGSYSTSAVVLESSTHGGLPRKGKPESSAATEAQSRSASERRTRTADCLEQSQCLRMVRYVSTRRQTKSKPSFRCAYACCSHH